MSRRALAVVCALLLCLAAAWRLLTTDPEAPSPPPQEPRPVPAQRADPEPSVAPARDAATPPSRPPAPPKEVPAGVRSGGWRLRGRAAAQPRLDAPVALDVRTIPQARAGSAPSGSLAAATDESGFFDVDLAPLFEGKAAGDLQVAINDARFLPLVALIPANRANRQRDGTTVFEAHFGLAWAVPLPGRVVDEDGEGVDGAQVAAYGLTRGLPAGAPIDQAGTGADGAFVLRTSGRSPVYVFAAAGGLLPAVAYLESGTSPGVRLVLRRGVAIAGRVLVGGMHAGEARVEAFTTLPSEASVRLEPYDLQWGPERGTVSRQAATADAEGRFVVTGLASGPHGVRVVKVPGLEILPDVLEDAEIETPAPAEDLEIRLRASKLRIAASAAGKPLARADVSLRGEEVMAGGTTNAEGNWDVLVRPGAGYRLTISAKGFEDGSTETAAPLEGGELFLEFPLLPRRGRAALVIVLEPAGGETNGKAAVALDDLATPEREFLYEADLEGQGNRFRLEEVDAGKYRLVVRPGGPWRGGTACWLPQETEVEVPAKGEVAAAIPLRRGGRLRVVSRDSQGRPVQTRCRLFDASGKRVEVQFTVRDAAGDAASHGGGTLAGGFNVVDPALPAGRYRLDFSRDGHVPRSVPVELKEGETAEVDVTLEPE